MKNYLSLLFIIIIFSSCAQEKRVLIGETEFQKKINADYKDASTSPLKIKDLKTFKTLDFFKYDSTFVVSATLNRFENPLPFTMKTTTDRLPEYVKYGLLSFILKGKNCELEIYRNIGLSKKEGYENHLFLPFLDVTNGEESYAGGRYIDCTIPEGNTMIIDFNSAYNPYCAYNEKYSCPIVPEQNFLDVKVEAGVKAFKKY